ncbi:DnaJ domain-containing protein [Phenylobacterium sp.]|uniref:J domain-containing protein n=1 Tax=Phenylobacterium sp. TaxID=1871053 RepID=UPI0035B4CBD3
MSGPHTVMTVAMACELLGVSADASAGDLRQAFRKAAKEAHPDRPGGDAERFRLVVEAHHVLQRADAAPKAAPHRPSSSGAARPFTRASHPPVRLSIPPEVAVNGGQVDHVLGDGRKIRIVTPAGLRTGDRFRAEETEFEAIVRGDGVTVVRGDDIWITLPVEAKVLKNGGRLAVETPHGRRMVIITAKAAAQGLVRLQGQGLPPRGRHRQGHLFLRLEPLETRNMARDILRRFSGGRAA